MAPHCKASLLLLMLLATVACAAVAAGDDAQPAPLAPLRPSRSLLEVKISGEVSIWEGGPKVGAPLQPPCAASLPSIHPVFWRCLTLQPAETITIGEAEERNQSQNL